LEGAGGGAGGGAILIASSTMIAVNGAIRAKGGNSGASNFKMGGGGAGGGIRLVAPLFTGNGTLDVRGGGPGDAMGGSGRAVIETIQSNYAGSTFGGIRTITLSPNPVLFSAGSFASIRIVSIGGISSPSVPRGSFNPVDVALDATQSVDIVLEGSNIPLGTNVTVTVMNEAVGAIVVNSTALAGTVALSNATATVTIPTGFSQVFTQAQFTP